MELPIIIPEIEEHSKETTIRVCPWDTIYNWKSFQFKGDYLNPRSIKNLLNSTPKKQTIQSWNGQKTWREISQRNTKTWPTSTWKHALHHLHTGKYKSKPQWDTTSHQWAWGKWRRQETINVGEDAEKREPSYSVSGNVNWCSQFGKLCGGSSKS